MFWVETANVSHINRRSALKLAFLYIHLLDTAIQSASFTSVLEGPASHARPNHDPRIAP
jgi:hypothetical protein